MTLLRQCRLIVASHHRANAAATIAAAITVVVATAVAAIVAVVSRPIGIFGSNQGAEASKMMHGWSTCPWMCRTGADSVHTMTSMSMMSSCRKYHGCEWLWLEVPYSTVSNINSYVKPFLIAEKHPPTTDLQIDDGEKNTVMDLGARKLTPLMSVRLGRHSFARTRDHGKHGTIDHSSDKSNLIVE